MTTRAGKAGYPSLPHPWPRREPDPEGETRRKIIENHRRRQPLERLIIKAAKANRRGGRLSQEALDLAFVRRDMIRCPETGIVTVRL